MKDGDGIDEELLALSQSVRDHLVTSFFVGMLEADVDAPMPPSALAALEALKGAPEGPDGLEVSGEGDPEEPAPAPDPWARVASAEREGRDATDRTDGVGASGLQGIRADLGDCQRCGLCEARRHIVFGVGDPEADLMVIGEGPGAREDAQGEPFVGEAGKMLDRMLENVLGLPRPQVYIANVVKCRPPDNRNPSEVEARTCLPFLRRQIAAVQPKVILLLGSVALRYVAGRTGIKRNRGSELTVDGVLAIPTFHPAYLLRRPEDKRLTFADLKAVRGHYDRLGGRR